MIDLNSLPPCGSCGRPWTPKVHDADEGERATYSLSCECGYLWEGEMPLPTWRSLVEDGGDYGPYFAALMAEVDRLQSATRPTGGALDIGPILARAEAATPGAWVICGAKDCDCRQVHDAEFPVAYALCNTDDGFTLGDGWTVERAKANATFIAHARTDILTLCAEVARLRAALSWQESRHGTQAEQEREEAETAAEMDAIDAMSEEQVAAELREAGIDVEAGRETCEALVRVALERNRLVDVAREGRAFTAALSKLLGDAGLLEDGPIHEAHLTAVRKLIERIASLETAASAVVEATASKPALVRITTTISPDGVYASGVMTARMPAETGDCRTCAHGLMCPFLQRSDVRAWVTDHTEDDARTRLPDSPSCPCYRAKETM